VVFSTYYCVSEFSNTAIPLPPPPKIVRYFILLIINCRRLSVLKLLFQFSAAGDQLNNQRSANLEWIPINGEEFVQFYITATPQGNSEVSVNSNVGLLLILF